MISPGGFVPVLIKYHLLYRLDLYMFEQVCREVKIRNDNDLPLLPVSVNFSRQDFDHADIAQEMDRLYEKYDLDRYVDKSYFIVEITEQDLATGSERLQEQLKQWKAYDDNNERQLQADFAKSAMDHKFKQEDMILQAQIDQGLDVNKAAYENEKQQMELEKQAVQLDAAKVKAQADIAKNLMGGF